MKKYFVDDRNDLGNVPYCPYVDGLACEDENSESCGKNCIFHPSYVFGSETGSSAFETPEELKAYNLGWLDALASKVKIKDEETTEPMEEFDGFDNFDDFEEVETLLHSAFKYGYKKGYSTHVTECKDEERFDSAYNLGYSVGQQHSAHEEEHKDDFDFFEDDETEDAFNSMLERLEYIKDVFENGKASTRTVYNELLNTTLTLNEISGDRFDGMVSFLREVRERMDEKEVVACIELVSGLVETARAFAKLDTAYIKSKECMDNFLRDYEADDAYRLTPCYGNCDGECELCPIDGHEKEYVFNVLEGELNYAKESLQCKKIDLRSLYTALLDTTLILNQVANGRFDRFVSLIREVCVRMDKDEADDCVALVVSLFETAKALAKVDKSYMKSKE